MYAKKANLLSRYVAAYTEVGWLHYITIPTLAAIFHESWNSITI
jgi:hypothetical protein